VLGNGRLGQIKGRMDLAHAQFACFKHLHDLDPPGIGQGLQDRDKIFHHISILLNGNTYQFLFTSTIFLHWQKGPFS
jgi:hypothetical protein